MSALLLKSIVMGFAIAAPIGPIGILCIQRSLHSGFKVGFITGIGATLANGTYGLIAGLGLTALSSTLLTYQFWIRVVGGLFLVYLGIKLMLAPSGSQATVSGSQKSLWYICSTGYLLTLINPVTLLSFLAIFVGLGSSTAHANFIQDVILMTGIMAGSVAWWLLLSGGVAWLLRNRINPFYMRVINWVSGLVILLFGLFALKIGMLSQ